LFRRFEIAPTREIPCVIFEGALMLFYGDLREAQFPIGRRSHDAQSIRRLTHEYVNSFAIGEWKSLLS
jgi:hypothetical protein